MPTVSAIVTTVPEVGPNARRWLVDCAVVQRAGSCPWVVMLGDYPGFHGGEAQNGAPSAGHLVNENWACCWSPRLER